jgi:heat shock protein HtpX
MAFDFGYTSIIIALIFSIVSAYLSYYNCDKIVLSMNKARPATQEEYKKLNNILDSLIVSSSLEHRPQLYVMDDNQPNAFATGRDPEHSVICVTTALLDKLEYYELEGVIAHELSHIANYDIRLSAIVTVMVGTIVMLSDMFTRTFMYRDNDRDSDSKGNAIIMLIGLICLIISPIFAKLLQLAVSRRREYLADATAVQYTRNPDGLISALIKISRDPNELKNASKSTAHMYISSPFRDKKTSLFSTHPAIEDRIQALRNIR